jgi:acetate kinase
MSLQRKTVLVFNPGSNSLKFEMISASFPPVDHAVEGEKLLRDVIEPVGPGGEADDHAAAAKVAIQRVKDTAGLPEIEVVGHRVVHGGERYTSATRIDDGLLERLHELEELAPLHNKSAAGVIRAAREAYPADIPQFAVFDTAFHRTIPDPARLYPIPWDLTQKHKIQRFGFHGSSHRYMMLRYAQITNTPLDQTNLVTLHLEGGSSATAIQGGRSVDTSMGLTPLEGLMMSTRCGDIDPALVQFLAHEENAGIDEVEVWLNKKSGLLGVSGRSGDTRDLVKYMDADPRCRLALEMFAYRVRKYVGAYLAATGGASAIVFGGGIGENTPAVRRLVCEGLRWMGLDFDPERNEATLDREGPITRDGSRLQAYVIPTEECLMIAHEALAAYNK